MENTTVINKKRGVHKINPAMTGFTLYGAHSTLMKNLQIRRRWTPTILFQAAMEKFAETMEPDLFAAFKEQIAEENENK